MVELNNRRQVVAARLSATSDQLTIFYTDGGVTSSTQTDPQSANKIVTDLGLLLGGSSGDGVRHWWR
jgi:hypothetical protein